MPGQWLGRFEILSPLGAGGMGEVYLARDTRLDREVALKLLPEALGKDPARRARFEAEARTLATLSDAGIAAIYGFEESDGVLFLVLEYVRGETLSERLRRGPLPIPQALDVARQVAKALEAAHRRGIVHCDLKCANVMLTPAGTAKLLDFGVARAVVEDPEDPDSDAATPADGDEAGGVPGGTAAYMSPEQALGQPLDARTDIWSFGCLLYEVLSGKRAFRGRRPAEVLSAVLNTQPDWSALPRATPEGARRLLRRCLQRDGNRRLHDIADARIEIEEMLAVSRRRRLRPAPALALLCLAGGAAGFAVWLRTAERAPRERLRPRSQVYLPPRVKRSDLFSGQTTLALSPDGTRLVFAAGPSGSRLLYDRPLDQLEAKPIAGTQGGNNPFFSPDGQWLGFDADGHMKAIRIQGGEPLTLCPASSLRGASWGSQGTIVFAPSSWSGLWQVPASGGAPRPLTTPVAGQEISHRWPQVLPGGHAAVFSVMTPSGREEERTIEAVSLETGARRVLVRGATFPRYLATGHLLYARGGALHAAPFDPARLALTGAPAAVLADVLVWAKTSGAAYFDVSTDGTLVYVPPYPHALERRLLWVDRRGQVESFRAPLRGYAEPALSPDGRRLAVTIEGPADDVYVYDLDRDTWTRLTFEGDNGAATWSPDGGRIAFTSTRSGARNLFWVAAAGSGESEPLVRSRNWLNFVSFSPDGQALVFTEQHADTASDLWMVPLRGDRAPRPLVVTPAIELFPTVSPDGRWLAYTSTESKQEEVYVRPFPGPGRKWAISMEGGSQPVWSPRGDEIFYRSGGKMMVVPVRTGTTFSPGKARVLFQIPFDAGGVYTNYSVSPDGRRFVMVEPGGADEAQPQIVVVFDWFSELLSKLR